MNGLGQNIYDFDKWKLSYDKIGGFWPGFNIFLQGFRNENVKKQKFITGVHQSVCKNH
jgi:hypothetical protein